MSQENIQKLDQYEKDFGSSKSMLVNMALQEFFKQKEKEWRK